MMANLTPSKLITDYFYKTPSPADKKAALQKTGSLSDGDTTKNVHNSNADIPVVLPPTPENSPFKNDIVQTQSLSSDIQNEFLTVKPKTTAAKSLVLDKEKSDQDLNLTTQLLEDAAQSTPVIQPTKKTRRKRKPRSKKSTVFDQSADDTASKPTTYSEKKSSTTTQNKLVTDYFPVRRSGRRCGSKIKEDKEALLRQCIVNHCENGLKVEEIEGKGRGVLATKKFDAGDFVVEYAGELVVLSTAKQREDNYSKDEDIGCYMYYFEHKGKRYCVDATKKTGRLGRLVNHSKLNNNCQTRVVEVAGTPRLILVATTHISVGQELLYDYGDRSPASIEAHPWLKT